MPTRRRGNAGIWREKKEVFPCLGALTVNAERTEGKVEGNRGIDWLKELSSQSGKKWRESSTHVV